LRSCLLPGDRVDVAASLLSCAESSARHGRRHHEPPDVTLPEPELADGALGAVVRLLLLLELLVLELLDVPEPALPEVVVLPATLPADAEAEVPEAVCAAPGSANAIAPAAITLAVAAVAVTVRSRACP
jgi:hypothetical protein